MADDPHLPRQALIEAYGGGGFRFAGMSHRGSLLIVPTGMYAWPPACADAIDAAALTPLFDAVESIDVCLIGTGERQCWPQPAVRAAVSDAGLAAQWMSTGAAVRTYNVLLGEGRNIAAALIAVA